MGEDVEHRLIGPSGFQIIGLVFGESAIVKDAEFTACCRPYHGIGLSTIVETRPPEHTTGPDVVAIELPTTLDDVFLTIRALFALQINALHPTLYRVSLIDVAGSTATGLLCTNHHPVGIGPVTIIDIVLYDIVIAVNINLFHHAKASTATIGIEARIIDGTGIVNHGPGNLLTLLIALYPPFLITDTPEGYRRVVAMINDHSFQQIQMLTIGSHQSVFVDAEDTQRVTHIEGHIGGWVV